MRERDRKDEGEREGGRERERDPNVCAARFSLVCDMTHSDV